MQLLYMSTWPLGSADIYLIRMTKRPAPVCVSANVCVCVCCFAKCQFISAVLHAFMHFTCVHSCAFECILVSALLFFHICVCVSVWGWESACLRGVLARCPALRGDKWLSVVVVQRADTQTAAHTWLIVSLLGLGPVDCVWAKASHPAFPGVCVCMCVNVCEQEREWWKAKTVTQRGKECYVLFYEFVCHCTLSLNMCYCFERWPHSEVVRSLVECGENDRCESRGWICPATFLCSLELDCAMLKVFNGLFPAIVSLPRVVMVQILWRVIKHALITWSKWKML